jgi:hypothetical protein
MTTQPTPKLEATAPTREMPNLFGEYVRPTVRCTSLATAHPSPEAWPERAPAQAPSSRRARLTSVPRPSSPARFAGADSGRERSLVVVPSRTIDGWQASAAATQAFEERLLCTLLELQDPTVRIAYVTSNPINPSIVDYYLSLLPRGIRNDARARLTLIGLGERTARPLSEKLLEHPRVLDQLRSAVCGSKGCHLVPYTTTELELTVAEELGIPMLGADPGLSHLGTKSGCRALFAEIGVPHPLGIENLSSAEDVIDAIASLRADRPGLRRVVVKLNDGVSGEGNAVVDLAGLPAPGAVDEALCLAERVHHLSPEAPGVAPHLFLSALSAGGGVVEEWIEAAEIRSPSAQLDIATTGEVTLASTHDQILGGTSGQTYLGCRFPAEPSYAPTIGRLALRVGERLAQLGVIGRSAIDFVVARDRSGSWRPYAIELNLRKGGTTHPYATLCLLTGGKYDVETSTFTTRSGESRHYVATDHLEFDQLRRLGCSGVLSLARRGTLKFDRMRRCGPVFHMLSSLDELGRAGFTAIADSAASADAMYHSVQATLHRHARALAADDLPQRASRVSVAAQAV